MIRNPSYINSHDNRPGDQSRLFTWGGKLMGLGQLLETKLHQYRKWRNERAPGPMGDFYRQGANHLLYKDLGISAEDIVIDAGGYHGKWSAEIMIRYARVSSYLNPFLNSLKFVKVSFKPITVSRFSGRGFPESRSRSKYS